MSSQQHQLDANVGDESRSPAQNPLPETTQRSSRVWGFALAAGLASGLLAWLAGEASLDLVKPSTHNVNSKGMIVLKIADRRQVAAAAAWNGLLAFMLLGASVGGAMGAAGGLARGSGSAAARAALVGAIVGAVGTVVMSAILLPSYNIYKERHPDEAAGDLVLPLFIHAAIWAVAGASGGAAFALGIGDRAGRGRLLVGGLFGALAAAILYEIIGAMAFPAAKTAQFVSETWQTRLFARLIVAICAAIGVAVALNESRHANEELASARSN